MGETILSFSGILFLPLVPVAAFVVTTIILRVLRFARAPGFRRRYDPEPGFLSRGPKLILGGVILLFVVVPTFIGVLVPPEPVRYAELVDSHEAPLAVTTLAPDEMPSAAERPSRQTAGGSGSGVAAMEGAPVERASRYHSSAPLSRLARRPEQATLPRGREPRPDDASIPEPEPSPERQTRVAPRPTAALAQPERIREEAIMTLLPMSLEVHAYRRPSEIGPEAFRSDSWIEQAPKIDVLFVHAHPDDESLDFAVLMAALSRRGLATAILLLTDGESGIDRYPLRGEYPGYDNEELSGDALRNVRVEEANRALSALGAGYYLRLGLPNFPYNGTVDERGLDELLSSWGGEEEIVERLVRIIRFLDPDIIVAPDGPSQAREHFEHEAAGHLIRKSTQRLADEGEGPEAYLVSVDPFQTEAYSEALLAVPSSIGGQDLRAVQKAALSQHHTQADASVIGLRRLSGLPAEYYLPIYWNLETSPAELLGIGEDSEAHEDLSSDIALSDEQEIGDGATATVD